MKSNLLYVNLALYLALALLASLYWRDLGWAVQALPLYLDRSIKTPAERTLYREAERNLSEEDWKLPHACESARRSLEIDPNTEAGLWLAKCLLESGDRAGALEEYRRYRAIDPVKLEPYLIEAAILVERAELDEARAVLERGARYFAANAEGFAARKDPSVGKRYNDKADRVAEHYRISARALERELARLDQASASD